MKRVLLSAALLLAVPTTGFASQHATRVHHGTTHAAMNSACPDPAHCPLGSCPLGSKAAVKAAAASVTSKQDRACSDPSKCPASCSRGHAAAATAAIASR